MKNRRILALILATILLLSSQFTSSAFFSIRFTPDLIVNEDGGFVITWGMLNTPYNKITFPGTHNSFAGDGYLGSERNQDLTMPQQLENGIRVFDLDVDMFIRVRHGSTSRSFDDRLKEVKTYAAAHPYQIITVRINDYQSRSGNMYARINGRIENSGLDDYIYNWDASAKKDSANRCFIPSPWPTLADMITAGKNVMFIHQSSETGHDVVDSSASKGLKFGDYQDPNTFHHYSAKNLEEFSYVQNVWDTSNNGRQSTGANRLFHIEVAPDKLTAGDRNAATKNNDGRRLYQIAKQYETDLLPDGRVPYVIAVDYFQNTDVPNLPINVVDACNRLNAERLGIDFANSTYSWELYPHEFDYTKNATTLNSALTTEVNSVYNDFKNSTNLDGHQSRGDIVATSYQRHDDFHKMAEYAVDGDFNTRWAPSNSGSNHVWGIDLGEAKSLSDIAIAWEYSHKIPAYTIYGSNEHSRFEVDMNNYDLTNDTAWTQLATHSTKRTIGQNPQQWDVNPVSGAYRYIKIKITDASQANPPSFWEVKFIEDTKTRSTTTYGGDGGDLRVPYVGAATERLTSIRLGGDDRIYSVNMTYNNESFFGFGQRPGSSATLTLEPDEFIKEAILGTDMTPEYDATTIHYMKLVTNTGRSISKGNDNSSTMSFVTLTAPSGYHINGFWGRSGYEVDQLGAIIKKN